MRIIGNMVVGPNESERYLTKALDEFTRLCDDVLIVTNNADSETIKMIDHYGFSHYDDDREWGRYQPRIKQNLVEKTGHLDPEWVLTLDADEKFDEWVTRELLNYFTTLKQVAWKFAVIHLWGDEDHYFKQLMYHDVRFYKYPQNGNIFFEGRPVHCGMAPVWAYAKGAYSANMLIHYGLMDRKDRLRKAERYKQYDPMAVCKGQAYYDCLAGEIKASEFDPVQVRKELLKEVENFKLKDREIPNMGHSINDVVRILRSERYNPRIVYLSREDARGAMLRHPDWQVLTNDEPVIEIPKEVKESENKMAPPEIISDPLECEICGYVAKSKPGLKTHKTAKGHI